MSRKTHTLWKNTQQPLQFQPKKIPGTPKVHPADAIRTLANMERVKKKLAKQYGVGKSQIEEWIKVTLKDEVTSEILQSYTGIRNQKSP